MKFLKLHDNDDNSVVIINAENIISVRRDKGTTIISLNEGEYDFEVTESPEKIFEMLECKKETKETTVKPVCS